MTIDWENIPLKDLAGFLTEEFKKEEIEIILVGGACVSIYSKNCYQSYDLDFVTYENMRKIKGVLLNLGFHEVEKYFRRIDCPWIIEFVSPPISIGNEPIKSFAMLKTRRGTIKMLTPTDSVKDRLASFFHWQDRQALDQARAICEAEKKIDFEEIRRWSEKEGHLDSYKFFIGTINHSLLEQ